MASFAVNPNYLTIPTEFSPTTTGISLARHMGTAAPVYDTYATILLRTHLRYPSNLPLVGVTEPLVPFTYVGMTVKAINRPTFDTHPFRVFGSGKMDLTVSTWLAFDLTMTPTKFWIL